MIVIAKNDTKYIINDKIINVNDMQNNDTTCKISTINDIDTH